MYIVMVFKRAIYIKAPKDVLMMCDLYPHPYTCTCTCSEMLCDISVALSSEFDNTFIPVKCQLLYYGRNQNATFNFANVVICASERVAHLGHIRGPDISTVVMLDASSILSRKIKLVFHNFTHCSYDVSYKESPCVEYNW